MVSEADAAAIRAVFQQRGELSASVELRRLFPGLDAETARECALTIVGWKPLPGRPAMPNTPQSRSSDRMATSTASQA